MLQRMALISIVAAGCTSDDVTYGEINVVDDGSGLVALSACLDGELLACHGESIVLEAEHGDATTRMEFSPFPWPEHHAQLAVGDRQAPFVIRNGASRAVVTLPEPFELSVSGSLVPDGEIEVTWQGAGEPMRWRVGYDCDDHRGTISNGETEDDGTLFLTSQEVRRELDRDGVSPSNCEIDVELSRISEGRVDGDFHADRATGVERGLIELPFVP